VKARTAREGTGIPAIADDSGIEARALGGRPGIHSARYAGPGASDEENLAKLLGEVAGAGDERGVSYVCALAYVGADGGELVFEGRCEGTLTAEPRGAGGFGYDPAFVPNDTAPGDERTMAELRPEEKGAISHRGKAARMLAARLVGARAAS
jgi:XTP/dITP diphosphohydrolase